MTPRTARTQFLKRLKAANLSLTELSASAGIEAMLSFFADERAEGCDPEDEGDMLLFQWGINDWDEEPAFEVNITRQFITDDDDVRQLAIIFRFDPSVTLRKLKDGNKWCEAVDELPAFRRFLSKSKALQAVSQLEPTRVELRFGRT